MSRAENTPWFKGWRQQLDVNRYNMKGVTDKDRAEFKRRRRIEEIKEEIRAEEEQSFLWL